jgi:hypothetical protein
MWSTWATSIALPLSISLTLSPPLVCIFELLYLMKLHVGSIYRGLHADDLAVEINGKREHD